MKARTFILTGIFSLLLASCSKEATIDGAYHDGVRLEGLVIDSENEMPVNHMKILIEWESAESPVTLYTSDKGRFSTILAAPEAFPAVISLTITVVRQRERDPFCQGKAFGKRRRMVQKNL